MNEQRKGAQVGFAQVGLTYGSGAESVEACRDVTFVVPDGAAVALIGPSGCGKSTTLHMAAGLLAPSAGAVRVGDAPVAGPRDQTSFIPQDLGLFPWKTVLQNAALGLRFHAVPRREADERARQALSRVGLTGFESAFPRQLSGGMRQRLALARALAMDADLLLMDEPLSAIDALQRESLQDTLLELWRSRRHTQLLVTHSIEEAVYLGQTILVFSQRPGTVVAQLENPRMGEDGWRASAGFAEMCARVRKELVVASGQQQDGDRAGLVEQGEMGELGESNAPGGRIGLADPHGSGDGGRQGGDVS